MKKRLYFLIVLCGLNAVVDAQAISQKEIFANLLGSSSIGIVRTFGTAKSIVYGVEYSSNPLGDHKLFLCDNSSFYTVPPTAPGTPITNKRIDLPGSVILNVYDMKVLGSFTYLCGRTRSNEGFIGWVDNNDFSGLSSTFHYVPIPEVSLVKKMVVYDDYSAMPKAVAIGVHDYTDGSGNHRDYHAIELNDASLPSASYRHINLGEDDVLHEVLYSVRYGVFFVEYSVKHKALAIRKADPASVVTTPLIHTLYYYPTGDIEVYSPTHSAIDQDSLAVSYMFETLGSGSFTTRIRYFDLATLSMNNSQEFAILDKSEPYDMIYCLNRNHWTPIIIQPDNSGGVSQSDFILLDPSATSTYITRFYYYPNETYWSADRFPSAKNYVAVGYKTFQCLQNASFAYTSPITCIKRGNLEVIIIRSVPQNVTANPLSDSPGGLYQFAPAPGINPEFGFTNCYDD